MKTKLKHYLLSALLGVALTTSLHAQLVADGGTLNFTGATNLAGDLIVGTNGGNTMLNILAPGTVTSADGTIGLNATSANNQVKVQNSGAAWHSTGLINVGDNGSGNQLSINNGGVVADAGGFIGRGSGSNNLAVVTGPGSLWTNSYGIYAGYFSAGNQLIVSNGGVVFSKIESLVGVFPSANNNVASVTGSGSLWDNVGGLNVGFEGSKNQLVVSNEAVVASNFGELGVEPASSNNLAVVTGSGSLWTNIGDLHVGYAGSGNQLVVSNGGVVADSYGNIGYTSSSSNSMALVTDTGSLWNNVGVLNVGMQGSGNQLVVTNGGKVVADFGLITGTEAPSANNRVIVDGGSLMLTNSGGDGVLDVRRGTNVFNAGLIQADSLLLTNSAGFFEFNGGTFIAGGGTVDNGQPFVVGASGTKTAVLNLLTNAPLTVNNDFILGANTAAGNQLLLYSGGVFSCSGSGSIGTTASNNLVVVDGTGSGWTSSGNLFLGNNTAGNRLSVAGGGVVANALGILGSTAIANNNLALVRDAGSLWINSSSLLVGSSGSGNQLVVSNGAVVASASGTVGVNTTASNNLAVVTGPGSLWTNSGDLVVGSLGKWNQLVVSDDGTVQAANAYVGTLGTTIGNRVTVDGGNLIITNSGGTGTLFLLKGTNVLNAGLIQTDNLLVNNGALSQFEFNGGTLITGGGTVNNGQTFVVGASGTTAGILDVRSGTPLTVNNGFTLGMNTAAAGNQLLLTNGGTISVTGESTLGPDASASNNLAVVSGSNSLWSTTSYLRVGRFGHGNQLVVSNRGSVFSGHGFLGADNACSAVPNVAVVTGPGSLWTNSGSLYVSYAGSGNQLMVSDGGVIASANGTLGFTSNSSNNVAMVTGVGSLWTNNGEFFVGESGDGNQLVVSDGGVVASVAGYVGRQLGANNNMAMLAGAGSLWTNSGNLEVGDFGNGNQLVVSNGGEVANADGFLGRNSSASNNVAVVTGSGSLWRNSANLYVGVNGSGNHLIVNSGGVVANAGGFLGLETSSTNNLAVVSGAGSLWTNSANLFVGYYGTGNQLVVSNGGLVVAAGLLWIGDDVGVTNNQLTVLAGGEVRSGYGLLGAYAVGADDNRAVVGGPGSLWTISSDLYVGEYGGGNQLVVTNAGTVQAANAYVGVNASSMNNRAIVDGGNLIITNSGGTGTLDIRRGTNVLNAGLIRTDNLLLTNSAGFFDFNGGTFITGGGTVNNGQPFVAGASGATAASLDVRSGVPLVVNNDFTLGANTADGNRLLLTNGGTLSVTGTSYVGTDANSTNTLVTISGPNSLWTNSSEFYFGYFSSGNQLVVSNGGALADGFAYIGLASSSSNNVAVVTGAGSTWTNTGDLRVGGFGSGNQLVVSNGGVVVSGAGYFAANSSESSNNVAMVAGPNSRWILNGILNMGYLGGRNRLVVSNGATLQATSVYVGVNSSSTDNRVTVSGGNLIVTNSGGTAVLDIRRGTNVLNAGLVWVDNLLLNNGTGFFEFNGGTLNTSESTVDNGSPLVVGNGSLPATLNLNGSGTHTLTDGLVISAAATLKGNGTVDGPLTVQSGGSLSPGASVGSLALNNSPVLQGSVRMEISKTGAALTSDQIQVAAPLTYGGNLVVSNLGPDALTVGNSFPLFSATSYGGAFTGMSLPSPGSGLMWTNQLLLNGSIAVVPQVQPSISGLVKSGTNLVFNVSGGSPGGEYTLLTSTDVTLPLNSWATNSTGNFDWMGNITLTNGINPDEGQRYFNVRAP